MVTQRDDINTLRLNIVTITSSKVGFPSPLIGAMGSRSRLPPSFRSATTLRDNPVYHLERSPRRPLMPHTCRSIHPSGSAQLGGNPLFPIARPVMPRL
jgi:hypothetical protein